MVDKIKDIQLEIFGLYRNSYLNQFHIRKMATLIGKSHVSLLPHLRKFEKDNLLLSEHIGKSKVYSINLGNNQVREFLSLSEKKKTLDFLRKEFFIKKIYDEAIHNNLNGCLILFGSYVTGTHNDKSDIDLLYIGNINEIEKKKMKEFGKAYKKDIHFLTISLKQFKEQLSKQSAFIKEVIKNHIILYNHDIFIHALWRHYYEKREK